jgi:hypothetical protein
LGALPLRASRYCFESAFFLFGLRAPALFIPPSTADGSFKNGSCENAVTASGSQHGVAIYAERSQIPTWPKSHDSLRGGLKPWALRGEEELAKNGRQERRRSAGRWTRLARIVLKSWGQEAAYCHACSRPHDSFGRVCCWPGVFSWRLLGRCERTSERASSPF